MNPRPPEPVRRRGRGRWAAGADARPLAGSSRGSQPDRTSGPPGFSVQKPPRAGRFPAKARDCGPARGRRPRVPGRPWACRVRLGLLGRVGGGRAGEWVGGGRPAGLADLVRGVERGCPGPGLGAGGVLAGPWMLALPAPRGELLALPASGCAAGPLSTLGRCLPTT